MLYSDTIEDPQVIPNVFMKRFEKEEDPLRITKTSIRRALADIAAGRVETIHIPKQMR